VWWFSPHLVVMIGNIDVVFDYMSGRLHRRGDNVLTLVLPSVHQVGFVNVFFLGVYVGEIHRVEL